MALQISSAPPIWQETQAGDPSAAAVMVEKFGARCGRGRGRSETAEARRRKEGEAMRGKP